MNGKICAMDILYIQTQDNSRKLKLGVMSDNGSSVTEKAVIRELTSNEKVITEGTIEVDQESGAVFVSKDDAQGYQMLYTFNTDMELQSSSKVNSSNVKIDIAYPENYTDASPVSLTSAIKLYPNPTTDNFSIATEFGVKVTEVVVYDNIGQVVKRVDVQSDATLNEFNVDYLKPGIYMVDIVSEGAQKVSRKLVVQ